MARGRKPATTPTNTKSTKKPTTKPKNTTKKVSSKPKVPPKNEPIVELQSPKKFHEVFPFKLEHKEKDNKTEKTCFFQCKEHMESYIKRYELKKTQYKISQTEER